MEKQIIDEIKELNSIDGKSLLERMVKFQEEYGEFSAEVCKMIGITHKPFDIDSLKEEMADAMQNLFSVYLDICESEGFDIEEIRQLILIKNKKWRSKIPQYTKNNNEWFDINKAISLISSGKSVIGSKFSDGNTLKLNSAGQICIVDRFFNEDTNISIIELSKQIFKLAQ